MLKKQDTTVAYILMATGILQLILLFIVFLGFQGDSFTRFLYNAFYVSALYIPALFFWASYLIIKKPLNKQLFLWTVASILIFFPFSTVLKILFSDKKDPVILFLHKSFDTPDREWGSVFILLGVLAIITLSSKIVINYLLKDSSKTVDSSKSVEETSMEDSENSIDFEEVYNELSNFSEIENEFIESESDNSFDNNDIESDPFKIEAPGEIIKHTVESDIDVEIEVETEDESLSAEIDLIKKEINEYYIKSDQENSRSNIPFDEPEFPETTEEIDIDEYDKSNNLLDELVKTELSPEEYEYLNSFDEDDTFSVGNDSLYSEDSEETFHSNVVVDVDPGLAFLADEENEDSFYESDEEEYDNNDGVYNSKIECNSLDSDYADVLDDDDYDSDYDDIEDQIEIVGEKIKYEVPVTGILSNSEDHSYEEIDDATKRAAAILEQTLEEFNIKGKVTGIKKGPVITMFELLPAPGVKLSKIVNLSDNIALGLAASSVRIVAPIPGKHAVGIEVPNKKRSIVTFSELIEAEDEAYDDSAVPIVLGKSINGENKIIDLSKTPHLLIAGATGAGKSVCVNSLICSILCKRSHNDVKLIMIDPKIVELKLYNGIPHLLTPVITDPKRAFQAIQWCLYEMERRYALLDSVGVRDIRSFNKRIKQQKLATTKLPYLVLIVDEFADLMATSGKELEGILARLAAMSRAVGIHLVLATQRPSIDVITGLIKANFPSRIAFMVSSKTDSRIILDGMGAEKLLGRGDMLFTSSWDPFPVRIQGSFLSDEEVESVVDYVKQLGEPEYIDDEIFIDDDEDGITDDDSTFYGDDPLFNRALEIVIAAKKASASFLQRRLKIGYNRAARLVEEMEERGIIGPQNGSKPRDILKIPDSHREISEYV